MFIGLLCGGFERISKPPFSYDTVEKGGYAVSFCIVCLSNLSKKAWVPDKDILVQSAKIVAI